MAIHEYEVEITLHEEGTVVVEAESAKQAQEMIRNGYSGWDQFYGGGRLWVGVRGARRVPDTEG